MPLYGLYESNRIMNRKVEGEKNSLGYGIFKQCQPAFAQFWKISEKRGVKTQLYFQMNIIKKTHRHFNNEF